MFMRADDGRYYNLLAMAEVEFRQRRDGAWQLVGRDTGCPISIVLADNIPNEAIGYAKAQFEQYVYGATTSYWPNGCGPRRNRRGRKRKG